MTSDPSVPLKYRHSILIIDDEESILNTFKRILASEDYEIHTACNGLDGLNKLHAANKPFLSDYFRSANAGDDWRTIFRSD
jgi:DNA-binding NtrC family response regulator